MFAVHFDHFGAPDVLTMGDLPEPHAGEGTIRIRVQAAGVAPIDLSLRSGSSPSSKTLAPPHIPGVDASGYVDEIGPGVQGVSVGDQVFGSVDISRLGGASAEYTVLAFWELKPSSLSWEEAGAAGTSIETATRALDKLNVHEGATLLIDGATGGVGSVAVQLAIARGARVIATGRATSAEFLARLGATPVAYGEGLPDRVTSLGVGKVDLALHVAGPGALPALINITGTPEAVLSLSDFTAPSLGVRLSLGDLGGEPNGRHGLADAAALAESGLFRVPVQLALPMAKAAEAHAAVEVGPRQGKVVLTSPSLKAHD
jgi:NADPH:quinone reductase-like Zn-dependent oxidoreductase